MKDFSDPQVLAGLTKKFILSVSICNTGYSNVFQLPSKGPEWLSWKTIKDFFKQREINRRKCKELVSQLH